MAKKKEEKVSVAETEEINRFDYLIKSNNIIGEKKGTVK